MTKTFLKSGLAVGAAVVISGCAASGGQMTTAEKAMNKAESAQQTANQAMQVSKTALQRANAAQSTANKALNTAQANSERMRRMFQQSKMK